MKPSAETIPNSATERSTPVVIAGIGTALPPLRVSQAEVLDFVLQNFRPGAGAAALYRRTMSHPGIQTRHFALPSLADCLETDADIVLARFEKASADLSVEALAKALAAAGARAVDVDFLVVSTCTGYICPGITSHVIERAGLRPDARLADLVGMGCGAALPALEAATNFITAHPGATAAAISVEICSAALFSNDEPGIVVSNALFADGAAAVILKSEPPPRNGSLHPRIVSFSSITKPEWRETLRFRTEGGRLKNVLGPEVPRQAAEAVEAVAADLLHPGAANRADRWILHAGGAKVIDAIQTRLGIDPSLVAGAREVLRRCGNMSSPTVLFVLAEECRRARPGDVGVMASFGAGFTAHGALLRF